MRWKDLPKSAQDVILYGTGEEKVRFAYDDGLRSYEVNTIFSAHANEARRGVDFPGLLAVQRVDRNLAVRWAAPGDGPVMRLGDSGPPLERL